MFIILSLLYWRCFDILAGRYLDIRVGYYSDTPEKFWLVHDFVKQNPLNEV